MHFDENLVRNYARHFYNKYAGAGFNVEYDEIYSELALVYAEVMDSLKDTTDYEKIVVTAFKRRIINYIKRHVARYRMDVSIDQYEDPEAIDSFGSVEDDSDYALAVLDLLRQFKGRELLIVKETLLPSDEVTMFFEAYAAKRPEYNQRGTSNIGIEKAMEVVYGMNRHEYQNSMRRIRKRLKPIRDFYNERNRKYLTVAG